VLPQRDFCLTKRLSMSSRGLLLPVLDLTTHNTSRKASGRDIRSVPHGNRLFQVGQIDVGWLELERVGALRETPETERFGPGHRPKRFQPRTPQAKKAMALIRATTLLDD